MLSLRSAYFSTLEKDVRPSKTTEVKVKLNLLSIKELVSNVFQTLMESYDQCLLDTKKMLLVLIKLGKISGDNILKYFSYFSQKPCFDI